MSAGKRILHGLLKQLFLLQFYLVKQVLGGDQVFLPLPAVLP